MTYTDTCSPGRDPCHGSPVKELDGVERKAGSMKTSASRNMSVPLVLLMAGLSLCASLAIGVGGAQAAVPEGKTAGTGQIDCMTPATVTFDPPMTPSNAGSVVGKLKFKASGACTGGSPTPSVIKGKGTIDDFSWDMCNGAQDTLQASITLKVTYPHKPGVASTLTGGWSGYALPNAWDTGVSGPVTGSYPTSSPSISILFSPGDEVGTCATGISAINFGLDLNSF
jgi:hypothetical protein